jgi:hypothetical protein
MSKFFDKYVFQIQQLLKTSRPGVSLPKVVLYKFDKKELCVFHTQLAVSSRISFSDTPAPNIYSRQKQNLL